MNILLVFRPKAAAEGGCPRRGLLLRKTPCDCAAIAGNLPSNCPVLGAKTKFLLRRPPEGERSELIEGGLRPRNDNPVGLGGPEAHLGLKLDLRRRS